MPDATAALPEESLQSLTGRWWVEYGDAAPVRGCLLWAFVPYIGFEPMTLIPTGRTAAMEHGSATYIVEPLRIRAPHRTKDFPVAALPLHHGEVLTVHKSKRRPAVVLSIGGPEVPRSEATGSARSLTNPTMIVAPCYGADQDGTRAGIPEPLRTRIWRCEYPQFMLDKLPIPGPSESLIRFDQAVPIGRHHNAYEQTGYRLSDEALSLLDEWLQWLATGKPPTEGELSDGLAMIRELASGSE